MTRWLFVGDSITVGLVGSTTKTGFRGPFAAKTRGLEFVGPFVDPSGLRHGGIGGSATSTFLSEKGWARFVFAPAGEKTWIQTYRPDVIHLMLGTNDLITGHGENAVSTAERLGQLVRLARAQAPNARIYVASIVEAGPGWFANGAREYNALLRETARAGGGTFIDSSVQINSVFAAQGYKAVTSDGTHPNDRGYDLMAAGLLGQLQVGQAAVSAFNWTKAAVAVGVGYGISRLLKVFR